jgi:uncharacterized protein YigE (DUF2233 family)
MARQPISLCFVAFTALYLFGTLRGQAAVSDDFKPVAPGIELREFDWSSTPTSQHHIVVLRLDPKLVSIQAVDTSAAPRLTADSTAVTADSSVTVDSTYAYSLREVDRLKQPLAAINGGATASLSYPIPVGLFQITGVTRSPLNRESTRQTGVVCIRGDRSVSILTRDEIDTSKCRDAIQAGPLLVSSPGTVQPELGNIFAERSVVAIDSKRRVLFINTSPNSLTQIAKNLVGAEWHLDVVSALNLDGSASAGMLFRADGLSEKTRGNIDATIPNALIAMPLK